MKRHEVLQPFSRDHNVGLVIARRLIDRPGEDAVKELLAIWDDEMQDHFAEEERLLIPLSTPEMADQLKEEHRRIAAIVAEARQRSLTTAEMRHLGDLLNDHIRWEERTLFPSVETNPTLQEIAPETDALEKRRSNSPHSPRRAELVQRAQKK